ncbi:AMP-binding protein [Cyclobacterium jeungdonense]|uniref:AMP-binding protein n=1 Tax=Cyclobacterium jeungdonense TaxID=708087 RepID=A0ABT8C0I1_9BACT|nr:AMP-binding protein [Cyclobacterium jeungdonense]MDN3686303.1 AMP-binding protein [Cyclobacterium jeungdonense]
MIIFGNRSYTPEEIKAGKKSRLAPEFDAAFEFCRQWLNGTPFFDLQTSGSTGIPKTVQVTRKQMHASVHATGRFFGIKKRSRMLCCLDTEKIAGKMMLVRALEWQGDLVVNLPKQNPLENLLDYHFDFAAMVPVQAEACYDDENSRNALNQIKVLIIGGAPVSPELREKLKRVKGKVYQTYGMTETVSHIALADIKSDGPLVYQALPLVKLKVDKENKLCIQSPMSGEGWLLTNDVVEMISNRSFVWKGRADFAINSGGIKMHPESILEKLSPLLQEVFPGRNSFLTGIADPKLGQALTLVIENDEDIERGNHVLKEAKRLLPRYHDPKSILFIPRFSFTSTGKIDQLRTLASWERG